MKYTGQQHDSATGLYYYGARYYDPSVGEIRHQRLIERTDGGSAEPKSLLLC